MPPRRHRRNSRNAAFDRAAVSLDVAARGAPAALVRTILEREGRLDIAFANAGISAGPGPLSEQGKIEAVSPERWAKVLDVNLTGVFETIQAAAEPMKRQGGGRIVVTTSTAGFRADPMVGYAYVATKAAVVNLVRQAAVDLARFNVLVNGIAPGPFRTNIGGGRMHDPETDRSFAESLPIGRVGRPEEIKGGRAAAGFQRIELHDRRHRAGRRRRAELVRAGAWISPPLRGVAEGPRYP